MGKHNLHFSLRTNEAPFLFAICRLLWRNCFGYKQDMAEPDWYERTTTTAETDKRNRNSKDTARRMQNSRTMEPNRAKNRGQTVQIWRYRLSLDLAANHHQAEGDHGVHDDRKGAI